MQEWKHQGFTTGYEMTQIRKEGSGKTAKLVSPGPLTSTLLSSHQGAHSRQLLNILASIAAIYNRLNYK